MANKLQKFLFSVSSVAPILIVFAIVLFIQNKMFSIAIISAAIGFLLSIYDIIFIQMCKAFVEVIDVSIDSIAPDDQWVIGYMVTYVAPLFSLTFESFNATFCLAIGVTLCIGLALANNVALNPLLYCCGYHFYKVTTVSGVENYCLITKRKVIQNKTIVEKVYNVFGYFLIERDN